MTLGEGSPVAARAWALFAKPLVFAGVDEGATVPQEYIDGLRAVGIPWFPSTERAYRAIARLADLAQRDLEDRTAEPIAVGVVELVGEVPEQDRHGVAVQVGG